MIDLRNPHDRFFRELFAHPDIAADFLRHYLPEKVAALLDPASAQLRKDSFVDEALQEHLSDLLYEVRLREGQEAYLYVLFEHKSYPEPMVAFQLLRYMVRIWEQEMDEKSGPHSRRLSRLWSIMDAACGRCLLI
jgi:predicted transposase/invertase (TIGR01784 family)